LVTIGAAGGGGAFPLPTAQAPTLTSASDVIAANTIFFMPRPMVVSLGRLGVVVPKRLVLKGHNGNERVQPSEPD
jgi:hypothetical protein